jgi:hypothetical protein
LLFQASQAGASTYLTADTELGGGYAGLLLNRGGASANNRLWAIENQPSASNTSSQFAISTYSDAGAPTALLTVLRSGNVGIGTTTPAAKLDVNGTARFYSAVTSGDVSIGSGNLDLPQTTSATAGLGVGVITMGGAAIPFIHACCPKSRSNTFVGQWAGNFTADASGSHSSLGANTGLGRVLQSLTSGYQNTASGDVALSDDTTGSLNTASGAMALYSNTTGSSNTASGVEALKNNTTGGINTAIGVGALSSNDAGSGNAAVGYCALLSTNRAGSSRECYPGPPGYADANTAIGAYAGATNTTGNSNTFVGSRADAASGGLTNATAIGACASVSANNALVLGAVSGACNGWFTANTNVGIGTPSPQAPLDVAAEGGIRISLTDSAFTNDNNELFFQDNGEIRSYDHNHRIIFDRPNNILEMREFGNIIFSPGANTGQRTQTVTLTSKGQVGIGTDGPTAELTVSTAGGDIIVGQTAGVNEFRVNGSGTGYFDGGTQTGGADFAESVAVHGQRSQYEPGDVLEIDPSADRHLALSQHAYSTLVAGIYSTKPGVLATPRRMDDPAIKASEVPLAVVGIVPCKVTAENGAIARGDLLVSSSRPGYAMKGTDRCQMLGAVVGKALQPLDQGTGVIEVLVTLQ